MDRTNEKRWTLHIMYLSDSGESLAPSQRKSCIEGLLYYVEPRKIPGWRPVKTFQGVNLHSDCSLTFVYRRIGTS